VANPITLGAAGGTVEISSSTQVPFTGVISGPGTLTKTGPGVLELDGNNTYAGNTYVMTGTVSATHANALGTTDGGTFVSSGATLIFSGAATVAETFTISGTGTVVGGTICGALHLMAGTTTLAGNIVLSGNAEVGAESGAVL